MFVQSLDLAIVPLPWFRILACGQQEKVSYCRRQVSLPIVPYPYWQLGYLTGGMDLTQESFDRLLQWLHPDSEEAGKLYVKIRSDLIKKFSFHGCSLPDRLADITIDRVAKKLPKIIDTYVGEREPYFHRVGYYVLLEYFSKKVDEQELPDDLPLVAPSETDSVEPEFQCLEKCMESLPPRKQYLIRNYYRGDKGTKIRQRKELASSFDVALPALRIQALRIRRDLRSCIMTCLQRKGR